MSYSHLTGDIRAQTLGSWSSDWCVKTHKEFSISVHSDTYFKVLSQRPWLETWSQGTVFRGGGRGLTYVGWTDVNLLGLDLRHSSRRPPSLWRMSPLDPAVFFGVPIFSLNILSNTFPDEDRNTGSVYYASETALVQVSGTSEWPHSGLLSNLHLHGNCGQAISCPFPAFSLPSWTWHSPSSPSS